MYYPLGKHRPEAASVTRVVYDPHAFPTASDRPDGCVQLGRKGGREECAAYSERTLGADLAHFLTADFSLSALPCLARWHRRYSASGLSGDHPSTAHLAGPRDGGGFPEHVCRERADIRLPQLSSASPSPALRVGLAHEVGSVRPGQQIDTVVSQGPR